METGTLGKTAQVRLDAVGAEAEAAVSAAADRLRALSLTLREAYGEAVSESVSRAGSPGTLAGSEVMASARALLERIDTMGRALQQMSHGLTPGATRDTETYSSAAILEAQEQERQRLAEELHDGPAQTLANIVFQTEIVSQAMNRDADSAQAELASLRALIERELDNLRSYINELRPSLGASQGLEEALRDAASELSTRARIPVDVDLGAPTTTLNDAERAVALRVAQEALRNIAKHADASRAWLITSWGDSVTARDRWDMEVGDDGRGFDVDAAATDPARRHFGLRFMRERAELLGAELSIDTSPSAGTVVRLSIETGGERS